MAGASKNKSLVNLFKKGLADLYSRPDDIGHSGEYLVGSQPVMSERFHIGQLIKKPEPENADFSEFIIHNQPLIFKCFLGYLLTLIAIVVLVKTIYSKPHQNKRPSPPFRQLIFFESLPVDLLYPQLKYPILAFTLFSFVLLALLSNSIKTQKLSHFSVLV